MTGLGGSTMEMGERLSAVRGIKIEAICLSITLLRRRNKNKSFFRTEQESNPGMISTWREKVNLGMA